MSLVEQQYEEAVSLIDLNPVRSRSLLTESQLKLTPFLDEFNEKSSEYEEITNWLDLIGSAEVKALKIYEFSQVPEFFDTSLVKDGGQADRISNYDKDTVILDKANKTLYILNLETKKSTIIAGSDIVKNAPDVSVHGKNAYLVNEDGIIEIDIGNNSAKKVIERDEDWGNIAAIGAFGGNVYLLDKSKNSLWKYIATENGFSDRRSYINQGDNYDFSDIDRMIIDGSIWISGRKEIIKFTGGAREFFTFSGIQDSFEDTEIIYTSDIEENLYLLDKKLARILVFDKDGLYLEQYQWPGLSDVRDFVVSEDLGKIFVLKASKLYSIDMVE